MHQIITPPVAGDGAPLRTLIDDLLEEQRRLTAVERFARRHAAHTIPAQSKYYRDLIPREKPGKGQQYAFGVDLDACTGCKGCVSACHSLNGLDDDELWRNVGLLYSSAAAYQQTVTTACHHCVDPACMNGCPVLAYDKDPETGIVRHLDDQCIGCQYCVLKCPYEVPKYSKRRGIVRKCDMCSSRLSHGEAPACVQACPNGAITIETIDQNTRRSAVRKTDQLLPGTVSSAYTVPSTTYRTRRAFPADTAAGDAQVFRLQDAHEPLVVMLVFSQMAIGLFAVLALLPSPGALGAAAIAAVGTGLLHAGLAASTLHLGKPLGAWRAFLGLRRSWMSREIVVFGALAGVATAAAAALALSPLAELVPAIRDWTAVLPAGLGTTLVTSTALLGLLAIYCSGMIYVDTQRPSWSPRQTFPRFFGTAALLGTAGTASVLAWVELARPAGLMGTVQVLAVLATVIRTALCARDLHWLLQGLVSADAPQRLVARALWSERRVLVIARIVLFLGATVFGLSALGLTGISAAISATTAVLLTVASQLIERYFYFVASEPFRMPGPVSPLNHAHP